MMIFGPWLAASDVRKGGRSCWFHLSFFLSFKWVTFWCETSIAVWTV